MSQQRRTYNQRQALSRYEERRRQEEARREMLQRRREKEQESREPVSYTHLTLPTTERV